MKTKLNKITVAVRLALGGLALGVSQWGMAQTDSSDDLQVNEPQVEQLQVEEEVVVTGSHIKGLDLEGSVKAVQLDRSDIEASGATSLGELLSTLPVVGGGTGTFGTTNSGTDSGSTPVGASAVSLRGLGTSSTLTLINGRRSTVSSFAKGSESFIDINSIPLAAIERVEILPSGASATYGADAVAGVINYKLRDDFDGTELSVQYGDSEASSNESNYNVNLLWGHNFDDANLTVVVDYYERSEFAFTDRDRLIEADPWGSSRSPYVDAWFVGDYGNQGTDENCDDVEQTAFGPECRDKPNAYLNVDDEFNALSSLVTFNKDFDGFSWFNELMYSKTESSGRSTPSTWRLNVATDNPGLQNDADLVASILDANRSAYDADFGAGATDALIADLANPGGIDNAILEMDTFGDGFMRINGRFPDAREFEVESETYRVVSGLEGQFDKWDWNTAISYAKNKNEQTASQGYYLREQLQHGLLGTLCSNGTILEGAGGRIVDIGGGD
ncbi:MAG: TonB-dependent receptor plug domain-containing protein, partial [Pseudomonadales bacterium]|nr:TonB-dependent receptor plug domain-containing protein [Pseudomonadales bacterium]